MRRRTFLETTSRSAVAIGMAHYLGGCAGSRQTSQLGDGRLQAIRDRYFVKLLDLNPVTSTYLGGDGYSSTLKTANGRLRDFRPESLGAEQPFFKEIATELEALDPKELSTQAQIDRLVVLSQVRFVRHQHDDLRYHERSVDSYVAEPFRGVDWQIQQMTDTGGGRLGTADEWNAVVDRVSKIPEYLEVAKANLLQGKKSGNLPDRRMVEKDGVGGSGANAAYFRATLGASAKEYLGDQSFGSELMSRLTAANEKAAVAWEGFGRWLGENFDLKESTDRFASGEAEYQWRVTNVLGDPRTVEELYQYGARQVELYQEKIFEVAREVAQQAKLDLPFDTADAKRASVRKVMDHLGKDSPKNDDEMLRWYREAGERAVQYGRDQGMFDIPADYRLDVVPTPPVLRSSIDAAYYPAPPFKKAGVGRFYLSPTGNDPAALALNNRASVADTAIHEGFPGHDWHYKLMTRYAAEISNIRWLTPGGVEDSSSMWEDSMAAEGWALYSEELMSEPTPQSKYGFYTPAEYLYELQGQLLRAVRVRVDVGIHTGRMTFDQARDYFTENVSFYPGACAKASSDPTAKAICESASRAIYRYSKWPTQAITYNLGKNAIVDLREAVKQKLGASFSAKTFHERLMRMGTIPVSYFKESFLAG